MERFFVTSAERWAGLQTDYDLRLARMEKERAIERDVKPLAALEPGMGRLAWAVPGFGAECRCLLKFAGFSPLSGMMLQPRMLRLLFKK